MVKASNKDQLNTNVYDERSPHARRAHLLECGQQQPAHALPAVAEAGGHERQLRNLLSKEADRSRADYLVPLLHNEGVEPAEVVVRSPAAAGNLSAVIFLPTGLFKTTTFVSRCLNSNFMCTFLQQTKEDLLTWQMNHLLHHFQMSESNLMCTFLQQTREDLLTWQMHDLLHHRKASSEDALAIRISNIRYSVNRALQVY